MKAMRVHELPTLTLTRLRLARKPPLHASGRPRAALPCRNLVLPPPYHLRVQGATHDNVSNIKAS